MLSTNFGSSDVLPACQPMLHQFLSHARKFIVQNCGGAHLLDAPQTPNISRSLRFSAGVLPLPRPSSSREKSSDLAAVDSLLLHVFSSIWGRVFIINARMKFPPIDVSSHYIRVPNKAYHWLGDPLMAQAKLCPSCDTRRCAPNSQLHTHRAGSDDSWVAHVCALDHQEVVWARRCLHPACVGMYVS